VHACMHAQIGLHTIKYVHKYFLHSSLQRMIDLLSSNDCHEVMREARNSRAVSDSCIGSTCMYLQKGVIYLCIYLCMLLKGFLIKTYKSYCICTPNSTFNCYERFPFPNLVTYMSTIISCVF